MSEHFFQSQALFIGPWTGSSLFGVFPVPDSRHLAISICVSTTVRKRVEECQAWASCRPVSVCVSTLVMASSKSGLIRGSDPKRELPGPNSFQRGAPAPVSVHLDECSSMEKKRNSQLFKSSPFNLSDKKPIFKAASPELKCPSCKAWNVYH